MNLSVTISSRFSASGGCDPDTLHGLLYIVEQGATADKIAPLLHSGAEKIDAMLEKARRGEFARVLSAHGSGDIDNLDGLLPTTWKRAVVALLLKADGATSPEIRACLREHGNSLDAGDGVNIVRRELKILGVKIAAGRIGRVHSFRYRIIGNDAWRMQKIIANGWML